ncbi:unnamed protein product [Closterium sp. NIES-64]|nr:unnamed protein product [Closterium sp. NIES-64]
MTSRLNDESADPVRTSTSGSGAPGAPSGAPAQYGASTAVGSTATTNGGRRWEQWDRTYDNVHFSTPRDGQFGGPGASSSYVPEDPRYMPTGNPPGYPVPGAGSSGAGASAAIATAAAAGPVAPKHNPLSLWGFPELGWWLGGGSRFLQYKLDTSVKLGCRLARPPPQLSTLSLSPKAVLPPVHPFFFIASEQREPEAAGDIRFLTRKIPIMGLLNLQVRSAVICGAMQVGRGHWARFQAQRDGVEVVTHLTKVPTSLPLSIPIPILPSTPLHTPLSFPTPLLSPHPPLLSHRRDRA